MAGDEYHICFGKLHVKTATWIIAIVHFCLAALLVVSAILRLTGVTDTHQTTGTPIDKYGAWGILIAGAIWMLFVVLLILGLKQNKALFVLMHLIYSLVVFIVSVVYIIMIIVQGTSVANIIWYIIVCLVILLLLFIEYKCYQFMK